MTKTAGQSTPFKKATPKKMALAAAGKTKSLVQTKAAVKLDHSIRYIRTVGDYHFLIQLDHGRNNAEDAYFHPLRLALQNKDTVVVDNVILGKGYMKHENWKEETDFVLNPVAADGKAYPRTYFICGSDAPLTDAEILRRCNNIKDFLTKKTGNPFTVPSDANQTPTVRKSLHHYLPALTVVSLVKRIYGEPDSSWNWARFATECEDVAPFYFDKPCTSADAVSQLGYSHVNQW